jgi:hypothetical protein
MNRILFLLIILTLGFAETILIPEDFGTIQAGLYFLSIPILEER